MWENVILAKRVGVAQCFRMKKQDLIKNPIVRHTVEFSIMVIKYAETLEANRKFVIANQLLRSATSIGASVMEAQSAESKQDFIHKLKIADKEANETFYWLYLCEQTETIYFDRTLTSKLDEIMRLLNSIILSAKRTNN
jgi:four helix bundle protein